MTSVNGGVLALVFLAVAVVWLSVTGRLDIPDTCGACLRPAPDLDERGMCARCVHLTKEAR